MKLSPPRNRWTRLGALVLAAGLMVGGFAAVSASASANDGHSGVEISSTGLHSGDIKHVWLIILENKSYDASFTGLNQNSYLWKTLPSQGVLHDELLRHRSLQPGQLHLDGVGPGAAARHPVRLQRRELRLRQQLEHRDVRRRTPVRSRRRPTPPSRAAPTHRTAANGCTYPTDTPTLFNQLDAAGQTWKGYAQDLGNQPGRDDGVCGGAGTAANNPSTNPTFLSATTRPPVPGRGHQLHRRAGRTTSTWRSTSRCRGSTA